MNDMYYTQREVDRLLKPLQLCNVKTLLLGKRRYYLKAEVNAVIDRMDYNNRLLRHKVIETFTTENVDLTEWLSSQQAQNVLNVSRQRLYILKDTGKIKSTLFDGFILFNKEDVYKRASH